MTRNLALVGIRLLGITFALGLTSSCFAAEPEKLGALRTDIEFANVGGVSLMLDAFVPPGEGPFATCILVHGGGFVRGDKQMYIKPLFAPLSEAGFTWFSINYRLAPSHRWPACADDVLTAVRWVKQHAQEYKVDVNRIALIGESAGGHLVSWAGTQLWPVSDRATASTAGLPASARGLRPSGKPSVSGAGGVGDPRPTESVAAVVPFYAPHDLEFQVKNRNALGEGMQGLFGLTDLNDATWKTLREASPSNYVHSGMPPYLLIHGDKDVQVPYEQSVKFQERMKAAGNSCELITICEGGHGMGGWEKLGSDYQTQLLAWLKKTLK